MSGDPKKTRRRTWLRRLGVLLGVVGFCFAALMIDGCASMGAAAKGARLKCMQDSSQWKAQKETFDNTLPEQPIPFFSTLWAWIKGADNERPATPPPIVELTAKDFAAAPSSGLRVTWLGHSTQIVEIDGQRLLLDPVWSKRASPFSMMGPARFHEPPLPLDELPKIDAVVISHDHYDHLDRETIVALDARGLRFVVPLGVGAHLEHWGVSKEKIVELDWWGETRVGDVRLVATPARHFSGRGIFQGDKKKTLWAGWALIGPEHRVYFSGDTGMFPGFKEIGKRLGPFDVTMIEVGAYNKNWADLHLGPEQAMEANRLVGGKVFMPVHWGTFALGIHGWTEPVERVVAAAQSCGARVALPRPGEGFEPAKALPVARWWPKLPWRTGEQDPIRSSGLASAVAER